MVISKCIGAIKRLQVPYLLPNFEDKKKDCATETFALQEVRSSFQSVTPSLRDAKRRERNLATIVEFEVTE